MKLMEFAQKIRHMIGKGLKFIAEILLADIPAPVLMPEPPPQPKAEPVQDSSPPEASFEGIPVKSRPRNRDQYEEDFKTSPGYYRIALQVLRELMEFQNLTAKDLQGHIKAKNDGVPPATDRTFRRVLGVLEERNLVGSQKMGPREVTHFHLVDKESTPKTINELSGVVAKLQAEATPPSHLEFEN